MSKKSGNITAETAAALAEDAISSNIAKAAPRITGEKKTNITYFVSYYPQAA